MADFPAVLSTSGPWDTVARGYAECSLPIMEKYSQEALARAGLHKGDNVLDVACGPGTLSIPAAKAGARVTALDFSEKMLEQLRAKSKQEGVSGLEVRQGDGQSLPFADGAFDVAFSMFGLMFFPDRRKGFSELFRVLKPGGRAFLSSWAPMERSSFMVTMFGALRAMDVQNPSDGKRSYPLEDPEVFKKEFSEAGFEDVRIVLMRKEHEFPTVETAWHRMVEGSVPIVMFKNSLSPDLWKEKEKLALAHLREVLNPLPAILASEAWLGLGTRPE